MWNVEIENEIDKSSQMTGSSLRTIKSVNIEEELTILLVTSLKQNFFKASFINQLPAKMQQIGYWVHLAICVNVPL